MRVRLVSVDSPVVGLREAKIAECDCGSYVFIVFQIIGHDHWHLECRKCGASYCPMGMCAQGDIAAAPKEG